MKQKLTILSVDDDPDCRAVIREAFSTECADLEFLEASNGRQAMTNLHAGAGDRTVPDLICLDMEMPGMSGMELLAEIRSQVFLREVPVIMVTGVTDDNTRREAMNLGASGYVKKTADPRILMRCLLETMEGWLQAVCNSQERRQQ